MAYADDMIRNQIDLIRLVKQSPTLNDFVIAYRNQVAGGASGPSGPGSIKNAFVKEVREIPVPGKFKDLGFGRTAPMTRTEQVYYTDADIKAMSPTQINRLFMGGSQLGFGKGERPEPVVDRFTGKPVVNPYTKQPIMKPMMASNILYEPDRAMGIPLLNYTDTRQTTFMHGLSNKTFSDAYNAIKSAEPEFLASELEKNYGAAQAVNVRRGLGAFMPGLIKGGALAGFGVGVGNLLSGASAATSIANPSSIAEVIANNSANVAAITGESVGGAITGGSLLSPSGGITTAGGAGQGAVVNPAAPGATASTSGGVVPADATVTLPSGNAVNLANNPFNVPNVGGGAITTTAGAGGSSIVDTALDTVQDNLSDITDLFTKQDQPQTGTNAGDSQQSNTGATAATVGLLGAAALAGSDSSNGDVATPPSITVGASPTAPQGLLSSAQTPATDSSSSVTTSTTNTTTQPQIATGGVQFHAAPALNNNATDANVLKVGGLF